MRIVTVRSGGWISALALGMALSGCGGSEEIALKEAPPVNIAPPEDKEATSSATSLKTGAPAKGSSAGLNFNPSQTDRAR